jgi:hypothetical protein
MLTFICKVHQFEVCRVMYDLRIALKFECKKKARRNRAYNNGLVSAGTNPYTILKLIFTAVKFFIGFFINMDACRL